MTPIKTLACNIFCRSDSGIAGSNPDKEMLFLSFVLFVVRN